MNNEGEVLEDMRGQDEEDQDCKPTRRELNTVVPDEHSVSRIEVPHDYCGEEYQEFKPKVDELTSKGRAHNGEKSTSKGPETAALAEVSNEEVGIESLRFLLEIREKKQNFYVITQKNME